MRWLVVVVLVACSKDPEPLDRPPGPKLTTWVGDEKAAFAKAKAEHKGVLMNLVATWSAPSEERTYLLQRPKIAAVIKRSFVPLLIDISNSTERDLELGRRYDLQVLEGVVLVRADGEVLARIVHLPSESELRTTLEDAEARLFE